jgi:hypothetical protein
MIFVIVFNLLFVELSPSQGFIFSRFQTSTLSILEMKLCNSLYLLFMKLSWSHDLGCEFNRLAHVDLSFFVLFLIDFVFDFIL